MVITAITINTAFLYQYVFEIIGIIADSQIFLVVCLF